jgi:hypothetical protein
VEASSSGDAERPAAERLAQPPPAFYALAPGAWRDYVTLLHAPYTAWHLSYVAIGAALAPALDGRRVFALVLGSGLPSRPGGARRGRRPAEARRRQTPCLARVSRIIVA